MLHWYTMSDRRPPHNAHCYVTLGDGLTYLAQWNGGMGAFYNISTGYRMGSKIERWAYVVEPVTITKTVIKIGPESKLDHRDYIHWFSYPEYTPPVKDVHYLVTFDGQVSFYQWFGAPVKWGCGFTPTHWANIPHPQTRLSKTPNCERCNDVC